MDTFDLDLEDLDLKSVDIKPTTPVTNSNDFRMLKQLKNFRTKFR